MYLWKPAGNRVEFSDDVGYLIFDPAWEPVTWSEGDHVRGSNWYEGSTALSFYSRANPTLEVLALKVFR